MPSLAVPKVLVHRDLDERYVADCDLRASLRHYQLVLLPGERGPLADAPGALYTAPWTVRDRGELLTRSEARKCWGFGDEPGVVVVGGGKRDEHASWRRLAEELRDELRGVATVRLALAGEAHWPLVEWLPGADLIIGGGGYNLVSEARLVGVPLLARALPRRYDPQRRRLRPHERLAADEDVAARAQSLLANAKKLEPQNENGVHRAVDAVLRLSAGSARAHSHAIS